ncbi:MAG: hypothetical protein Q4C12_00050 [Clostridia bacterium]|nr:hypothetical protein [Clostridia bacterium]
MKEKYVEISISELQDLLETKARLNALECGGVDNWEWYGESFNQYVEDNSEFDDFDEYLDDICSVDKILRYYKPVKIER